MIFKTYLITGKNTAGEEGTWDIEAKDEESLNKIIKDRGLQANKINGEDVKRARLGTLREVDNGDHRSRIKGKD